METSSVVRYLEAYRMRAFSGITVLPRLSWDIKAKPWLVVKKPEARGALFYAYASPARERSPLWIELALGSSSRIR
jgi:hypothetical protein